MAAAQAAQELKFGHWVQSSTQATRADRAGQVMYSRAKVVFYLGLSLGPYLGPYLGRYLAPV